MGDLETGKSPVTGKQLIEVPFLANRQELFQGCGAHHLFHCEV